MLECISLLERVELVMLSNKNLCNGEIRNGIGYEDFAKVFKVFTFAPFFEDWKPEQVLETYNTFSVKDGSVFGYYLDEKCVSILTLRPFTPGEHPVSYPDNSKTMYLSDVATLPKFRGMGIGTKLFLHALRHTKVLGYDNIYLRTNEKGTSMSYGIAKKCGFTQIPDICQEVYFPRTNPYVPDTDLRIFMEREI